MKLAILFLVLGAALALPQNFFLSFYPKHHASSFADPSSPDVIRGPVNSVADTATPLRTEISGDGHCAHLDSVNDPYWIRDRAKIVRLGTS